LTHTWGVPLKSFILPARLLIKPYNLGLLRLVAKHCSDKIAEYFEKPIYDAIEEKDPNLMRELLIILQQEYIGVTPFLRKHNEDMKANLQFLFQFDTYRCEAFCVGVEYGNHEIVNWVLSNHITSIKDGSILYPIRALHTALMSAVTSEEESETEKLSLEEAILRLHAVEVIEKALNKETEPLFPTLRELASNEEELSLLRKTFEKACITHNRPVPERYVL